MALYLLDTSIFLHAVRRSPVWLARVVAAYDPISAVPRGLYSVVTEGELGSLAIQLAWGSGKQSDMKSFLAYFTRTDISDSEILKSYAIIDAHCKSNGLSLGKNDLWIAATASVTGAMLLTTDKDFDALDGIFLQRTWIDPN